jgi:hypothetical protein
MEENQDFAALRDASSFIQLHAKEGLRCSKFFRELLEGIRRNVSNSRRNV